MHFLLPLELPFDLLGVLLPLDLLTVLALLEAQHALESVQSTLVHALGESDLQSTLLGLEGAELLLEAVQLLLMLGHSIRQQRVRTRDQQRASDRHC